MVFFIFQTYKTSGPVLSEGQTFFLQLLSAETGLTSKQLEGPLHDLLTNGRIESTAGLSTNVLSKIGGFIFNNLAGADGYGVMTRVDKDGALVLQQGGKNIDKLSNKARDALLADFNRGIEAVYSDYLKVNSAPKTKTKKDEGTAFVQKKEEVQSTSEEKTTEIDRNIVLDKTIPPMPTKADPNVLLDTQYSNAMVEIKDIIDRLSHFSTFDDLKALDGLRMQLSDKFKALKDSFDRMSPDQRSSYEQRLIRDMHILREGASSYWADALQQDGTLDESMLFARGSGLVTAITKLNELDTKLALVLQGPVSQTQLEEMRSLYNALRSYTKELNYLLGQRYGEDGAGLADARSMLGLGASSKPVATKYLEIVRTLIETQRPDLWGMSQVASSRYPNAYKTLSTSQIDVILPNLGLSNRNAFDTISRMAYLRLVSGELSERFDDVQMEQMLLTLRGTFIYNEATKSQLWSASIPPGMAYLIFSRQFFNNVLAPLPDAGLRQQVFNQASILLSSVYGVSDPTMRYSDSAELMARFEKLSVSGNLVSDMEVSNVYGTERGHIGQRVPWQQVQIPYQQQDMSTLWMFTNSLLRPPSYFAYQYMPKVNPYQPLQQTNMNYLMEYEQWEKNRFLSTMPNAWYLTTQYASNYLGRYANYGMILGEMNEAFAAVVSKHISSFSPLYGSAELQTGGSETTKAVDLRGTSQGRSWGQRAYGEIFGEWGATKGSVYSPTTYNVFDAGSSNRQFATLQASQLQLLGTNIWQTLGEFYRNANANERDAQGNKIRVGGLKDETSDWRLRQYLNSTFPGASDGTTIAFVNYDARTLSPTTGAGGLGQQSSTLNYDIDIFTKKGNTWLRTIDKGRTRDLLQSQVGGGETTLGDGVKQYFAQLYSQMGTKTRISTAGEVDERYYQINPAGSQPTNTRLGAMLIMQPGATWASGGIKTTTDDWSALFGTDNNVNMVHGGFYSFNPAVMPTMMRADRAVGLGATNYYYPTYELDEVQPSAMPNLTAEQRTYALSGTWLMLEQFRASLFGGWKGDDNSLLAGGKFDTKNSNIGAFFHFDENKALSETIITGGGRFKKLNLGVAEVEDVRTRAYVARLPGMQDEAAGGITFKAGKDSELSLFAKFNSTRYGTTPITERTARTLYAGWKNLDTKLGSITADQLLDINQRYSLFRTLMQDSQMLASDGVQRLPLDDLYTTWLANFSVAYRSPTSNWVGTTAITEDGGTFLSGLYNYRDRVAFIGGVRIGGDEAKTPDDAYQWLLGGKIRPSDDLAFSLYIAPTKDNRMVGGVGGEMRDVFATSISAGHEYYNAYLSVGPRAYTGHIDLLKIGGLQSWEIGGRLALGASTYLALGYRQITTPGPKGLDRTDLLVQQALKQDLLPNQMSFDQLKMDIDFDLGYKNRFTLTGQMNNVMGKNTPYDFYFGGRWSMSPF